MTSKAKTEAVEPEAAAPVLDEELCPPRLTVEQGRKIADLIIMLTDGDEDEVALFISLIHGIFYDKDRSRMEEVVRETCYRLFMGTVPGDQSFQQFLERHSAKLAGKEGAQ